MFFLFSLLLELSKKVMVNNFGSYPLTEAIIVSRKDTGALITVKEIRTNGEPIFDIHDLDEKAL